MTAACLMVSVTVINAPWASAIGVSVAVVASLIIRNKAATLAAVTIIIPACVSFSLMYGLFGSWATAAALSLRFAAVVGCGVMFDSLVNPDALMRALQTWLPASIVYVVGSVVRLIPMATSRMRAIQQIQRSRGVKSQRRKLVIPLVVGLVTDAAQRSRPLSRTGIAQPGRRTVLYPVRDRAWERMVRFGMVAVMCAACVWGIAG
ncbi:MAG: energy-coupling factor transporter transmembrane component T [Corynebacterium kroppenstedtii]|uniref:energy-coupling factor transporter transmembrane component T family protein n=1 Tax=Corynebacterium kroppenstedtii TaxID=161879 RepID=UPI0026EC365C|nr:energy-coupling factor transporter transmembrane component T [Corynebacterium kroppenstedtii]MDU7286122.1 energy-coupling factor transporter transmembrane component T [Corynebacterium kroppenstedtii]